MFSQSLQWHSANQCNDTHRQCTQASLLSAFGSWQSRGGHLVVVSHSTFPVMPSTCNMCRCSRCLVDETLNRLTQHHLPYLCTLAVEDITRSFYPGGTAQVCSRIHSLRGDCWHVISQWVCICCHDWLHGNSRQHRSIRCWFHNILRLRNVL